VETVWFWRELCAAESGARLVPSSSRPAEFSAESQFYGGRRASVDSLCHKSSYCCCKDLGYLKKNSALRDSKGYV